MSSYPPAQTIAEFEANIAEVMRRIDAAAARAGRSPSDVRLLPVSKTVPQERLRLAVAAGCRELGENKVQEAKRKSAEMADLDVSWAVIGHLQTNKAKDVAAVAAEFQALDSVRVTEALDRRLQALGRGLDVYVQVNTSAEEQKYGLPPAEVPAFLDALPAYTSLRVRGFMTLAEFSSDEERVRACFRRLREVRDRAVQDGSEAVELSMGMSGDYEIAVEEGSTCVRVGQAIFGSRATPDSAYWPAGQ
ncbi:YggS family pyridoxal phosphate-dependent enzyme [Tsukamurella paurometabola]|uniref:Pyridoxal phosphate homeostasis protein n=1 Tax=Tsukamurella paurometabola TaxID=2061 RepID=A0A3P8MED5_TSUPA|nr:YggS family pyridoxal phosphate-dependent enzyme [Tsukamurella paurometabola]UEA82933.1 YggS family pyridoxal phosphate-dependent enzyme [Tsukamurella paurometabola]VDR40013.1 Predicted enzyme with a TIM-barrel fold [Tsukamurella paurometabola]